MRRLIILCAIALALLASGCGSSSTATAPDTSQIRENVCLELTDVLKENVHPAQLSSWIATLPPDARQRLNAIC